MESLECSPWQSDQSGDDLAAFLQIRSPPLIRHRESPHPASSPGSRTHPDPSRAHVSNPEPRESHSESPTPSESPSLQGATPSPAGSAALLNIEHSVELALRTELSPRRACFSPTSRRTTPTGRRLAPTRRPNKLRHKELACCLKSHQLHMQPGAQPAADQFALLWERRLRRDAHRPSTAQGLLQAPASRSNRRPVSPPCVSPVLQPRRRGTNASSPEADMHVAAAQHGPRLKKHMLVLQRTVMQTKLDISRLGGPAARAG